MSLSILNSNAPEPFRPGKWSGLLDPAYLQSGIEGLFRDGAFPSSSFSGTVIEVASNVARTLRIELPDGRAVFAKHYFRRRWDRGLWGITLPAGALRSWKAARIMAEEGIACPRPVCVMMRKRLGVIAESVFVTEEVKNLRGRNLEQYFRQNFSGRNDRGRVAEKREIIAVIAAMYRSAHSQERIYFPDFHPHNMVYQVAPGGERRLYLVDFDEVRFGVRKDDRMKNLSSLCRNAEKVMKKMGVRAITVTDRLRFVKAYLAGEGDARKMWKEIGDNWNLK